VIKKNTATDKHIVRLSVAINHHVGICLGNAIGIVGKNWSLFIGVFDSFDSTKNLARGGLIDTGVGTKVSYCLKNTDWAKSSYFSGVKRMRPAIGGNALSSNVINS